MKRWMWLGLAPVVVAALLAARVQRPELPDEATDRHVDKALPQSPQTGQHYIAQKDDGEWGTVKGQIVWGGDKLPERTEINVGDNPDKEHCLSKGKLYDEKWTVNKENKGVRWVFVWLQPEGSGTMPIHPKLDKPEQAEVTFDQPCCQFVEHAFAMRVGQVLIAKNSAPVAHNVKWFNDKNGEGNVLVRAGGSLKLMTVKPSNRPLSLDCNIHTWMHCWVRIFDHPYYAVTDADGKFEIKLAPAGKYRLVVWHEEGWGPPGTKDGNPVTIKGETDVGKIVLGPSK